MKTSQVSVRSRCARFLAIGLALSACMSTPNIQAMRAQETAKSDSSSFSEKEKSWEEKMSDVFRDVWRGLGADKNARSMTSTALATASVDLRELENSYTVRLHLPNRNLDKVQITWENDILRIAAPAEGKAAPYQQAIALSRVAPDAKPQIERKAQDNMIVVTVPKSTLGKVVPPLALSPMPSAPDLWDQDVLAEMSRMQRQMDRIVEESFSPYRSTPLFQGYFNQLRFGSSVDLQEENGNYVVRAYLPNRDMNNVNVTVKDLTLTIEAKAEDGDKSKDGKQLSQKAYYSQLLTLPGPVKIDKMVIDRKTDMLVITLPKAS